MATNETATVAPVQEKRALPEWAEGFAEDYKKIFIDEWSPYLGFMLLVSLAMMLMASGVFWGVFGGLKLWGDHLNNAIGLGAVLGISENLKELSVSQATDGDSHELLDQDSAALDMPAYTDQGHAVIDGRVQVASLQAE